MHPSPIFRREPQARVLDFARERGFGALTIAGPGKVLAAHVPFLLEDGRMAAHVVRSNPLARRLAETVRRRRGSRGFTGFLPLEIGGLRPQPAGNA